MRGIPAFETDGPDLSNGRQHNPARRSRSWPGNTIRRSEAAEKEKLRRQEDERKAAKEKAEADEKEETRARMARGTRTNQTRKAED
jgi:hypothetical protein